MSEQYKEMEAKYENGVGIISGQEVSEEHGVT